VHAADALRLWKMPARGRSRRFGKPMELPGRNDGDRITVASSATGDRKARAINMGEQVDWDRPNANESGR
jgi:hypothetical protein